MKIHMKKDNTKKYQRIGLTVTLMLSEGAF